MKQYKLLNNIFGWIAFAVAAFTYLSTVEPTASFWDCPEFVACAAKGEVGHPPGNAFFNLTGRFFVNFAGGDMSLAAVWVNRMSALFSAGTILFLFWTITALTKKLVCRKEDEMSLAQMITILGAGMVGSLAYTWSDTFWFSAVEAEVYAFSSFMTALAFWLILKWENHATGVEGDRYIILIAYLIGLSIGVHLLNLLCIPAIVLVYYFKKVPEANLKGTLLVLTLSMLVIAFILYGLVPGLIRLASVVELFFVNGLGFSYNSGTLFYFIFVIALIGFGLWKVYHKSTSDRTMRILLALGVVLSGVPFVSDSWFVCIIVAAVLVAAIFLFKKLNARLASNIMLCLLSILVGYSTFAQVIIRSSAQLPMDENSPDEIFSFTKYLNRDQYGESPLFFGQTFASDVVRDKNGGAKVTQGAPLYTKVVKNDPSEPDRYEITGYKEKYEYNYNVLFPRMYSKQGSHISGYKEWSDFKGEKVRVDGKTITVPTFGDNMTYFLRYQLNFMYWRYFMWNFSGRQSDVQSYGEIDRGNWITGIPLIDEKLVGNQDEMPTSMKENKGRNVFYMLPLLLGLIGLFWQAYSGNKGIQGFWVVFFLFFMTGIAIVLYLNQTPYQPRERDYAYAGSFYAFAIWIGMGVAGLATLFEKALKKENAITAALVSIVCLGVPFQMVGQTWDDHDRSGRYTARDFGRNYLSSLDENAIIFTNGDNDTFPLWYAQDVENFRTDVRVCNLSYLQTDWYINQMKRPAYESTPLPIPFRPDQYNADKLNYAHVLPVVDGEKSLSAVMNYLYSDDPKYKQLPNYGQLDYIPTGSVYVEIDSAAVMASPVVNVPDPELICDKMHIDLSEKSYITKNEIAMLSMIEQINKEGWKRPIYFAATVGSDMYLSLDNYFRLTGLTYQIVPLEEGGTRSVDVEKCYDNMMNKFAFGNIADPNVYLDENESRMCRTHRMMFCSLVEALLEQGDYERALKVAKYCDEVIPGSKIAYDYTSLSLAQAYFICGEMEEGARILRATIGSNIEYLNWAFQLSPGMMSTISRYIREHLLTMREVLQIADTYDVEEFDKTYDDLFSIFIDNAYNKYKVL